MGETPRRSGFRLPWGDSSDESSATPGSDDAAEAAATDGSTAAEADTQATTASAEAGADSKADTSAEIAAPAAATSPVPMPESPEANHFLRELVDAMRGVAESSRDANLGDLRASLDKRVEELRAAAAQRAEELRARSEQDITEVGEWEQSEIERIRSEAEHRRDARRARLERELTEHQAASDRQVEETRQKLTDYEGQLARFFAELAEIQDPAVFVTTAKQMPPPPDLGSVTMAAGSQNGTPGAAEKASSVDDSLAQRLAQLDKRLAGTAPDSEPAAAEQPASDEAKAADEAKEADETEAADETKAADEAEAEPSEPADAVPAETPAAEAPTAEAPAADAAGDEASTPIVVKGLGSFGAITSFKQALERVEGVRGVTLSLGPTGEFVYRASHSAEFDIIAAIRSIEGQGAGIEETDGSVLVTIERQR